MKFFLVLMISLCFFDFAASMEKPSLATQKLHYLATLLRCDTRFSEDEFTIFIKSEFNSLITEEHADINNSNILDFTPLHLSLEFQNVTLFFELMKYKPEINRQNIFGDTPLHIVLNHPKSLSFAIKPLIEAGAKFNLRNIKNETPLDIAFKNIKNAEKVLLSYGANAEEVNQYIQQRKMQPVLEEIRKKRV